MGRNPLPDRLAKKRLEIARRHIDYMAEQLEKGAIISIEFQVFGDCERLCFVKNNPEVVKTFFGKEIENRPREVRAEQILRKKYRKKAKEKCQEENS